MLSLCTVVSNRLWQLKQTLAHNIKYTKVDEVEICIAAYNDATVLPYLQEHYAEALADGRIVCVEFNDTYVPIDGSSFACGHAKVYSHQIAKGNILFNLDADNFMDDQTLDRLVNLRESNIVGINPLLMKGDGRAGRIGIHRKVYDAIGGYRDKGRNDDSDLIRRAKGIGCRLVFMPCPIRPISNIQPNEV